MIQVVMLVNLVMIVTSSVTHVLHGTKLYVGKSLSAADLETLRRNSSHNSTAARIYKNWNNDQLLSTALFWIDAITNGILILN